VRWRIDVSARNVPGEIHLTAGGDVRLLGRLRAAANGPAPQADGGTITVDAGASILSSGLRARIRADGSPNTAGGVVTLTAGDGISLNGRVGASGRSGGNITVFTSRGPIFVNEPLSAKGRGGKGGSIALLAVDGALTLSERADAEGENRGGTIYLIGGRSVSTFADVRAGADLVSGTGGAVTVASNGDITVREPISVDGNTGGDIQALSNAGGLTTIAPLIARGKRGAGGMVMLRAGTFATVDSNVDADGGSAGGAISLDGKTLALTNRGGMFARGDVGGTIEVSGDSVSVAPGAKMLVDGDTPGGRIRLAANAGDLTLSGSFRARGTNGGVIEGAASQNIVADGMFAARGNGCIGLFAGLTLDVAGGDFDVPVAPTCP
ncbi:MAG: hypothetical protein ABI629_23260, partial [bacterium]